MSRSITVSTTRANASVPASSLVDGLVTPFRSGAAVPSFLGGTRIATGDADIQVALLAPGMLVRTRSGGCVKVRWVGRRELFCARHPRPRDVWPVRVRPGAFGDGTPRTDLFLSPDHAVFIDGALIPVRLLVNGRTVVQEPREVITYWHVELDEREIILAEGVGCETYPGGGPSPGMWPRICDGAELSAARSWLMARAAALGHAQTDDPGLRAVVGDHVLLPVVQGTRHRFRLPNSARCVRLVSRSAVPAELREHSADTRRLGVAVQALTHGGRPVALTDWRLGGGWHARERDRSSAWRWTDGNAGIVLAGGEVLEVEVKMTERYWNDDYLQAPALTARALAA